MQMIWSERRAWTGAASLAALDRGLEQMATAHAAELGVGIERLHADGRAWVLSRISMRVDRWPVGGEMVEWRTWPSRRTSGVRATRDFELRAADGALLAAAESTWLILDLKTRRPARLPRYLLELPLPEHEAGAPWPEWPAAGGFETVARRTVSEDDLDVNRHVNNVSYVVWAEQALGAGVFRRLAVEYLGEAFLGDAVAIERGGEALNVTCGERTLARLLLQE